MAGVDTCDDVHRLFVMGRGVYPRFTVSPPLLRFGACKPGETRTLTVRVTNTGVVPVEWSIPQTSDGFTVNVSHGTVPPPNNVLRLEDVGSGSEMEEATDSAKVS